VKVGVVGPLPDDGSGAAILRDAASFLLLDAAVDQVVFLGDGKTLDPVIDAWMAELGRDGEDAFLHQAAKLAIEGSVEAIHALLGRDDVAARLGAIRKLPPPPTRAIELIDDRIVLFVHDKAVLDEEDIANASVIVYARSDESVVKRFGKRAFCSPGPLAAGHVLVLEPGEEGLTLALYDVSGKPLVRETLGTTFGKLTVA
jgi:hypothetical protein